MNNILLWIIQAFLAFVFLFTGFMKMSKSKKEIAKTLPFANDFSSSTIKFIGIMETLGAIGLILPIGLGVLTILTPLAAIGLAVIMILAFSYHAGKDEYGSLFVTAALFALSVLVAYGRLP